MIDIIGMILISLLFPTILVSLIILIFSTLRFAIKATPIPFRNILKSLLYTIIFELLFIFIGGFLIGIAFSQTIGYGFPAVVLLLTLILGIFFLIYLINNNASLPFKKTKNNT